MDNYKTIVADPPWRRCSSKHFLEEPLEPEEKGVIPSEEQFGEGVELPEFRRQACQLIAPKPQEDKVFELPDFGR